MKNLDYFANLPYGTIFRFKGDTFLKIAPSVKTPQSTGNCITIDDGVHWQLDPNVQVEKASKIIIEYNLKEEQCIAYIKKFFEPIDS